MVLRIEYELNQSRVVTATTSYYSVPGARVVRKGTTDTSLAWVLTDHLGSSSVTVSAIFSNPTGQIRYEAYRATRWVSGNIQSDKLYTGQREEVNVGLYYYNARWYSPSTAKFVSADPIISDWRNPQSLNRYSYSLSNPHKYIDPSGHIPIVPLLLLAAFIIVAIPGDTGPYPVAPATPILADITVRALVDPYDWFRTGQDCSNSQCGVLDVAGALLPLATGGLGRLDDLSDVTKASSQASTLSSIRATQPLIEGTLVPKSFEITAGGSNFWVHPNATEHMAEILGRGPAGSTRYATEMLMESFH